ncbi:MAG: hypothetical protein R3F11_12310 [Verrucomicrobiales bacterium]
MGDSTAGNATITTEQGTNFRLTGNADLGTARVTVVGNANANNTSGAVMTFGDSASAANGTITVLGATGDGFFEGRSSSAMTPRRARQRSPAPISRASTSATTPPPGRLTSPWWEARS